MKHFYNNVLEPLGVTRKEWQYILESGVIPDLVTSIRTRGYIVRNDIRITLGLDEWPEPTYFDVTVKVNRDLTMRKVALLTGCETQPAEHILDRSFLGALEEVVKVSIFHFGKGRQMHHDEVTQELHAYGFRPVLLEELLALSAQHPQLQTRFPIAGVGCNEGIYHFWMIDCPVVSGREPRKRRVGGNFSSNDPIYDFYRVAAVRDPRIIPTKYFSQPETTVDRVLKFVDAEHEAMLSAYRPYTA